MFIVTKHFNRYVLLIDGVRLLSLSSAQAMQNFIQEHDFPPVMWNVTQ